MRIEMSKLKAILGVAVDKVATDFIKNIAEPERISLQKFTYTYKVDLEKENITLEILYQTSVILDASYFYTLLGSEDGALKVSLCNSHNEEFLAIEFEPNYDFESIINQYNA